MAGGGALYMCLSWYFLLRITFRISLDTIKRRVEPVFYLYSIFVALFLPNFFLAKDLITSYVTDGYCVVAPNYSFCNYTFDGDYNCYFDSRDTASKFKSARYVIIYLVAANFALVFVAMIIILGTVCWHTKKIRSTVEKRSTSKSNGSDDEDTSVTNETTVGELRDSRTIITQALMYILSYLVTWIFMIIPMSVELGHSSSDTVMSFEVLKTILFPMQGFWNLIIFVFDKAYMIRLTTDSRSWYQAVIKAFKSPEQTSEVLLTNLPSLPGIRSPSEQRDISFPNELIRHNELVHVEEDNKLFYMDFGGFRRTGISEFTRNELDNASASIESPCGFVSDSNGSILT
jgi:hypothetical protein